MFIDYLEAGVGVLNALLQFRNGSNRPAGNHRVTHTIQFIDTALQQVLHGWCRFDTPIVNRNQQGLDLMTEITHGRNTGHASSAFERVQMPAQFAHRLCRTLLNPLQQRLFGSLQEFGGFLGKNRRYFCVVAGLVEFFLGNFSSVNPPESSANALSANLSLDNRRWCRLNRRVYPRLRWRIVGLLRL